MRLTTLQIKNYKSIEDSTKFSISDLTCLVGKNESGKTALLQALEKLNPVVEDRREFQRTEYPRHRLPDLQPEQPDERQVVVRSNWELDDSDKQAILDEFGAEFLKGDEIEIRKGYDNKQYWTVPVDEKALARDLISRGGLHEGEVEGVGEPESIQDLVSRLERIEEPSERHSALLSKVMDKFPNQDASKAVINILRHQLPKLFYFADYDKLPGRVSLNQLTRRQASGELNPDDQMFIALLALVGSSPDAIEEITRFEELTAELEGVSNSLSREIFTYWSQNKHLRVRFGFDAARAEDDPPFNEGYVFNTRIENLRHGVTVSFDDRSAGFVWFFSFLVWLSHLRNQYGTNMIILLDEPALSLHAKAQGDLLRYMRERLIPEFQVVYTTHSPFMIDPEDLMSARTVEDVVIEHDDQEDELLGTKVGEQVLSTDRDTLFPLQAALGYDITQTLFVGRNVLLVEGPSDLLYLKWISSELKKVGRTGLDSQWVITPSGGLDKISSFLALFRSTDLNVAILTDYAEGQKGKVRSLRESELLRAGHVFSADQYANQGEADTEDVLGRSLYVELVNQTYNLKKSDKLPKDKPNEALARVVKEVEAHFRTLTSDYPEFDHYEPASHAIENAGTLREKLAEMDKALDRFEKLFSDLNQLISEKADPK